MPVLAVCRGTQMLNVALGGDLVQHLPEALGHEEHRAVPGDFSSTRFAIERGSSLARCSASTTR